MTEVNVKEHAREVLQSTCDAINTGLQEQGIKDIVAVPVTFLAAAQEMHSINEVLVKRYGQDVTAEVRAEAASSRYDMVQVASDIESFPNPDQLELLPVPDRIKAEVLRNS